MGGPGAAQLLDPIIPFAGLPAEVPPPGCAPDAYKLFIGNVPSCYTERVCSGLAVGGLGFQTATSSGSALVQLCMHRYAARAHRPRAHPHTHQINPQDLRPLFESVGPVVELVVLYDKQTGASKGSAFCWYQSRPDAERAMAQFNERHLLPDPTGHQQRPLVVRPATVRRAVPRALLMQPPPALGGGGGAGGALGALGAGRMQQQMGFVARQGVGGGMRPMHTVLMQQGGDSGTGFSSSLLDSSAVFGGGDEVTQLAHSGGFAMGGGGGATTTNSGGPDSGGYAIYSGGASITGGGGGGAVGVAASGGWDTGAGAGQLQYVPMPGTMQQPQQQQLAPPQQRAGVNMSAAGSSGSNSGCEILSIQVPLLASQLQAVTPHVFNIQSASGAEVSSHAVAPGVFCLRVSGNKMSVDAASQLISSVIQNA
jgi:CUG-BP- and ETR3-like factor